MIEGDERIHLYILYTTFQLFMLLPPEFTTLAIFYTNGTKYVRLIDWFVCFSWLINILWIVWNIVQILGDYYSAPPPTPSKYGPGLCIKNPEKGIAGDLGFMQMLLVE